MVYIEKGQKYFNDRPNTSPLDAKQKATIIYIRIKLALVLNKIFMNIIENKYRNKIYFEYEIITNATNIKPKAINWPVEAKFNHS